MPPASTIAVVDYGRGNLRSVSKALQAVGARVTVTSSPAALARAAAVVVPGVGAFGDAMAALRRRGLVAPLRKAAESGRPLLGVCLGLQIFCDRGLEFGRHRGFGFFKGEVRPFRAGAKVPHMGWNNVRHDPACPLFRGLPQDSRFYFVHSFHAAAVNPAEASGMTQYASTRFASALWRGNIFATQFHPEKSQRLGLEVYRNFWKLTRARRGR